MIAGKQLNWADLLHEHNTTNSNLDAPGNVRSSLQIFISGRKEDYGDNSNIINIQFCFRYLVPSQFE